MSLSCSWGFYEGLLRRVDLLEILQLILDVCACMNGCMCAHACLCVCAHVHTCECVCVWGGVCMCACLSMCVNSPVNLS